MDSTKGVALVILLLIGTGVQIWGWSTEDDNQKNVSSAITIAVLVLAVIIWFEKKLRDFISEYIIVPIGKCILTDKEIAAAGRPGLREKRFQIEVL